MHSKTHHRPTVFLAALFVLAAALVVSAVTAEEREVVVDEKHVVKVAVDGDVEVIEVEDLEEGESRQFFTDGGHEIVVTRTADGLDLEVDGEALDLDEERVVHKEVIVHRLGGDGEEIDLDLDGEHRVFHVASGTPATKVIVKKKGDGSTYAWSTTDGEEIDLEGLESFEFHTTSAADFLREKGVLDDLDEDQRRAILDALEEYQGPMAAAPRVKVMVLDDEEEQQ